MGPPNNQQYNNGPQNHYENDYVGYPDDEIDEEEEPVYDINPSQFKKSNKNRGDQQNQNQTNDSVDKEILGPPQGKIR